MRSMTSRLRLLALTLALALASLGVLGAAGADPILEPVTETLFISAGCPQDTPGTCTSTRWLGTKAGDATSNFLTATTPVDEALFRLGGEPNWRDYPSDGSLRPGRYPLRADDTIDAVVRITARGLAANTTVHARINARIDGKSVAFSAQEQVITIVGQGEEKVAFSFDIPDVFDGKVLERLTFETAVHGINAQGGYIDQQGGSTVTIPYSVERPAGSAG
jgi:hypothetical protein